MRRREGAGSVGVLGHGAGLNGDCEVVDIRFGGARVPLRAEVVDWPGWLFWWDVVRSRQWKAVGYGHELVFGPSIGVIVNALPEGRQAPLDLSDVNLRALRVDEGPAHTCSCRTVGLLKSSGPV